MQKLSINLVVQNGEIYIPFLFDSLKKQSFKDYKILIWDNGSTDNTVSCIEKELENLGIEYRITRSPHNIGFAAGHNELYRQVNTLYFTIINVDMYVLPDVFAKMALFLDRYEETVSVAPRLMRWDFEKISPTLINKEEMSASARIGFTSQIDAIGIRLFKNRRAVEWLTQQQWAQESSSKEVREIFDKPVLEVFGVSGAFSMYRKSIVDRVLLPGNNFFDPTYHSYKEDLDLAYRLRNAGFVSYVILDAVAYHDRTGAGPRQMSDFAVIHNKSSQSFFVKYHSYKNHIRTLYKNEYWQNIVLDAPSIILYELKKFFYFLFTSPSLVIRGWIAIIKYWSYTTSARKSIVASRRMPWKGIRRWL